MFQFQSFKKNNKPSGASRFGNYKFNLQETSPTNAVENRITPRMEFNNLKPKSSFNKKQIFGASFTGLSSRRSSNRSINTGSLN